MVVDISICFLLPTKTNDWNLKFHLKIWGLEKSSSKPPKFLTLQPLVSEFDCCVSKRPHFGWRGSSPSLPNLVENAEAFPGFTGASPRAYTSQWKVGTPIKEANLGKVTRDPETKQCHTGDSLGFMGFLRVSLVIYGIYLGFMGWN